MSTYESHLPGNSRSSMMKFLGLILVSSGLIILGVFAVATYLLRTPSAELESLNAEYGKPTINTVHGITHTPNINQSDQTTKKETITETEKVTSILSDVGKTFQKINANKLRSFIAFQHSIPSTLSGASLKTYNNSKVREGETIGNPGAHAKGYEKWVSDAVQKQIDKAKSEKGKQKYKNIQKEYIREARKHTGNLKEVITFQNYLVDAKMLIVKKLNSVKQLTDTFIKTKNGFKVTNPEGFVAIDRVSGGAVKLVDRMEFSFNNFSAVKAWDK